MDISLSKIYKLTHPQKRIWYVENLTSQSALWNIGGLIKINKKIDFNILSKALNIVIKKNEAMRFQFIFENNNINQVIRDYKEEKLDHLFFKNESSLEKWVNNDFAKGLSLYSDKLYYISTLNLNNDKSYVYIKMHHIISDGWSVNVITNQFCDIYNKLINNEEVNEEVEYSYLDFIKSEENYLASNRFEKDKKYWNQKFDELPDRFMNGANDQETNGERINFHLTKDSSKKIRELCSEFKVSLNTFFIAILSLYVSKTLNKKSITIGMGTSNRFGKNEKNTVGMFVSTMAFNYNIEGNKPFKDLLSSINSEIKTEFVHQKYPYDILATDLKLSKKGYSSLYDIAFTYLTFNGADKLMDGASIELSDIYCGHQYEPLRILVNEFDEEQGIILSFDYKTNLFTDEDIKQIYDIFNVILNQVLKNNNIDISSLEIVSKDEKNKLLNEFNNTEVMYPKDKTILELFEEQVNKTPNNIALVFEKEKLTYRELNERTNALGRTLKEEGVKSETIVAIIVERSIEMIVGILGVLKAGGAYLPIDPEYPIERINYILESSGTKILLTNGKIKDINNLNKLILDLKDTSIYNKDSSNLDKVALPHNAAYVIYTSGTTGMPKGVVINHSNLVNYQTWFINKFNLNENDKTALLSSCAFDLSYTSLYSSLLSGCELHVISKDTYMDTENLLNYIVLNKISYIKLTPSLFSMIVLSNNFIHSSVGNTLRLIVIGGEQINVRDVEIYNKTYPNTLIVNHYGPTETTIGTIATIIDFSKFEQFKENPIIGKPINNANTYILGENNQLKPVGISGELCVSGAGVARGYLNREELTSEKFVDNPFKLGTKMYRTGDLARWLPDGNIEYIGRIDNQIKIRGFRVELGEIENQILKIKDIKEAIIVDKSDKNGNKYLCGYITAEDEVAATVVKEELSKELPSYMIPSYIMQIEKLPLTPNGKIDKKMLPEPDITQMTEVVYEAPKNKVEKILIKIWEEILGIDSIGINHNYYELGGDSIKSIQIASRLHKYNININIRDIMKYLTIKQLSEHVKYDNIDIDQGVIEGEVALTPIQKWFFQNEFSEENHWNQAFIFYKQDGINEEVLRKAFTQIVKHHDALRMVYEKVDDEITQRNRGLKKLEDAFTLDVYDLREDKNYKETIKELSNNIHKGMDLEKGILVKLGLFTTSQGDHLFIAIHHLVVDGISWRILLEDFGNAYESIEKGKEVKLPQKTTSFKEWAQKLNQYANSRELLKEKEYWRNIENIEVKELQRDFEKCESTVGESRNIIIDFSKEETEQLLRKISSAYNTHINDILLCALGLAFKQWCGNETVLVNLEGHGREDIISNVPIERTIGWFTSHYPVIIDMTNSDDISYCIKYTKETLRHIPNKGIGYGIFKYLTNEENKQNICFKLKPEIKFNYLGEFSENHNTGLFKYSKLSSGMLSSATNKKLSAIEINGVVIGGELKLIFNYSTKEYTHETMTKLSQAYIDNLTKIIKHCESKKQTEKTPWDYGDNDLTIEDLSKIIASGKEIEMIHSLTSGQEVMVSNSVLDKDSHAYVEQNVFTLEGLLNVEILNKAVNALIEKYDMLRTAFFYDDISKPKLAILKNRKMLIHYEDISDLGNDKKEKYVEDFKNSDKYKSFDLTNDCLMRISVIKTHSNKYKVVFSVHHIILDGWSTAIIMKDIISMYKTLNKNKEIVVDKAESYGNYLEWLDKQDKTSALEYWNTYLAGYEKDTVIPKLNKESGNYNNDRESIIIDEALTSKLKNISEKNNMTLSTVIQTAWGILLQKYNSRNDVVFGSVVSGRPSEVKGIENMVGLFINAIPLRVQGEEKTQFIELANKVNNDFIESDMYSYCSLSEIQALSSLKNKLINHVVIYENYPISKKSANPNIKDESEIKITDVEIFRQVHYNLGLGIFPSNELKIVIVYNRNIYSPEIVSSIKNHLYNILNCIAINPEIKLCEINIKKEASL